MAVESLEKQKGGTSQTAVETYFRFPEPANHPQSTPRESYNCAPLFYFQI
jgi:hypothetical protein